jgi:hypothetical protein
LIGLNKVFAVPSTESLIWVGTTMGSDSETKPKGSSIFSAARIKDLFKKYGKVALGVHIVVYSTFLTGTFAYQQRVNNICLLGRQIGS